MSNRKPERTESRLEKLLTRCSLIDAARLRRRLYGARRIGDDRRRMRVLDEIDRNIATAAQLMDQKQSRQISIKYPEELPITGKLGELREIIASNQVTIVCGQTGSGKSTQLPKLCLNMGFGVKGMIAHTQPRRIAARTVAARVASELNTPLGDVVGYKVRFGEQTSAMTRIKVLTDGMLLAETQNDRQLLAYDTIIIDEAHERSLNIDFLLGYVHHLLGKRQDLKLIITSATIDPQRFSEHFNEAPIIQVSGRTYPVETRYRTGEAGESERDLPDRIVRAVDELASEPPGDVLVFLSGEREIREAAQMLRRSVGQSHGMGGGGARGGGGGGVEILPLYSRLSMAEQTRIFKAHTGRRIVLATNVAETSLTVPGIRYVVDTGLARISRFSSRSKMQRLPIEAISQASADQRAGRCGRVAPGVCIRLYSQEDYEQREAFTPPEILRSNLAGVILQMRALNLPAIEDFGFIEPPRAAAIRAGYQTLFELGAVDEKHELTPLGRRLATLPVDPRVARMIFAGEQENCLEEILIIASALSVQDPRERPAEKQNEADTAHEKFADEYSDFVSYLNLWKFQREQSEKLSRGQFKKCCRQNFLSQIRLREWQDLHRQLIRLAREQKLRLNQAPGTIDAIHRALLTGLLAHIGCKDERGVYKGTRGSIFAIFPGSVLNKQRPSWVVAGEIVETSRVFARCVGTIEPAWVERVGKHVLKRQHSQPRFDEKSGKVIAQETVTMLGLEIVRNRTVHLGLIDPPAARKLFIEQGLVEGLLRTRARFMENNRRVTGQVRAMECKARQHGLLADDDQLYAFYERILPEDVYSLQTLDRWRKKIERHEPEVLFMKQSDALAGDASEITPERFPDQVRFGERALRVRYVNEPGSESDGITVETSLDDLELIDGSGLIRLVPGVLEQVIIALLHTLPKAIRKRIDLQIFARSCLKQSLSCDKPLEEVVCEHARHELDVHIDREMLKLDQIPQHLRVNVRVYEDQRKNEMLTEGRDLAQIRKTLAPELKKRFAKAAADAYGSSGHKEWNFGTLEAFIEIKRDGVITRAYPMLMESADGGREGGQEGGRGWEGGVNLALSQSAEYARAMTHFGLRQLVLLRHGREIRSLVQHDPSFGRITRIAATLGDAKLMHHAMAGQIVTGAYLAEGNRENACRDDRAFEAMLELGWERMSQAGRLVCDSVDRALAEYQVSSLLMEKISGSAQAGAVRDVQAQLRGLLSASAFGRMPWIKVRSLPRFAAGARIRLERLEQRGRGGLEKDIAACMQLRPLLEVYGQAWRALGESAWYDPELIAYRWMIEEYRVFLFAPSLMGGGRGWVSLKEINKARERMRERLKNL